MTNSRFLHEHRVCLKMGRAPMANSYDNVDFDSTSEFRNGKLIPVFRMIMSPFLGEQIC